MFGQRHAPRAIADLASVGRPMRVTVMCLGTLSDLRLLRRAASLVANLGAEVHVLAPVIVPYPLPLDRAPVHLPLVVSAIRNECLRAGIAATVDLRLCRDFVDCVRRALSERSTVLVLRRPFWHWRYNKLKLAVRRDGHNLVLL